MLGPPVVFVLFLFSFSFVFWWNIVLINLVCSGEMSSSMAKGQFVSPRIMFNVRLSKPGSSLMNVEWSSVFVMLLSCSFVKINWIIPKQALFYALFAFRRRTNKKKMKFRYFCFSLHFLSVPVPWRHTHSSLHPTRCSLLRDIKTHLRTQKKTTEVRNVQGYMMKNDSSAGSFPSIESLHTGKRDVNHVVDAYSLLLLDD